MAIHRREWFAAVLSLGKAGPTTGISVRATFAYKARSARRTGAGTSRRSRERSMLLSLPRPAAAQARDVATAKVLLVCVRSALFRE
jgi:hypothetical protein